MTPPMEHNTSTLEGKDEEIDEMPEKSFGSVVRAGVCRGDFDRRGYINRDRLHLRGTTEQHVPEVEVQVKRRRTASLSNQECQLYPRRSQQQQVPVVDFQAELRQAFLAETPRGG
ncbi:SNRPN upstream reading frame protein-like [Lepus europaeus]|uniref:SNRPN upstream reading frame protein-like n=1 Tax=Lepus europaeus TaxID=9983 RepID=UPI002B48A171|nr:SNRPN upstream reading frame protein-like [Lepus europaeus]